MKNIYLFICMIFLIGSSSYAADTDNDLLREEIRLLKEKLTELENKVDDQINLSEIGNNKTDQKQAEETNRLGQSLGFVNKNSLDIETGDSDLSTLGGFAVLKEVQDHIVIDGIIEVLGYYSDFNTKTSGPTTQRRGSEDTSDVIIDQVRVNFDIDVTNYVSAYVGLQFEDYTDNTFANFGSPNNGGGTGMLTPPNDDTEDDENLHVDEAYITIGGRDAEGEMAGLYGIFGKQYFPFGNVNEFGNFINDTLAKQLYETRDTGVLVGHAYEGLDLSFFAFNGRADRMRSSGTIENQIETWGASVGYNYDDDFTVVSVGASYLDNIFQAQNSLGLGQPTYMDTDSQAFNIYGVLSIGPLWLGAEYVGAFNEIDPADIPGVGTDIRPEAITVEGALTCDCDGRDVTFAAKYEANNDQDDFGNSFVDEVWGLGVGASVYENTRLTLNFEKITLSDQTSVGAPGGYANLFLAELSVGF